MERNVIEEKNLVIGEKKGGIGEKLMGNCREKRFASINLFSLQLHLFSLHLLILRKSFKT